jgi:hypothetical protein
MGKTDIAQFVGVANAWSMPSSAIKQQALMFDRVAAVYLSHLLKSLKSRTEDDPVRAAEIEWLVEQEVVYEPVFSPSIEKLNRNPQFARYLKEFVRLDKKMERMPVHGSVRNAVEYLSSSVRCFDLVLRLMSLQLRESKGIQAVPLVSGVETMSSLFEDGKQHVAEIVLNRIPQPDDSVSWEQILDFRRDPDTKGKFWGLRTWMSEVGRAQLTSGEIIEKLEWSLYEYEKHMKLHRMKTNLGTVRTVVTVAAEVAEDLVKFKWGKAAKLLFTIKDRKVALMDAELRAPGRELAYMITVIEKFSLSR